MMLKNKTVSEIFKSIFLVFFYTNCSLFFFKNFIKDRVYFPPHPKILHSGTHYYRGLFLSLRRNCQVKCGKNWSLIWNCALEQRYRYWTFEWKTRLYYVQFDYFQKIVFTFRHYLLIFQRWNKVLKKLLLSLCRNCMKF